MEGGDGWRGGMERGAGGKGVNTAGAPPAPRSNQLFLGSLAT